MKEHSFLKLKRANDIKNMDLPPSKFDMEAKAKKDAIGNKPTTYAALKQQFGDRVRVRPPFHVERVVWMHNGCCRDLPVLLTSNILQDGKINYSAQCGCDGWATTGFSDPKGAIYKYRTMNVSDSIKRKLHSDEYQKILTGLNQLWLLDDNVASVQIEMYFRKADGQEQGKVITWRNMFQESLRDKKQSYEYNRVLEILEDYWLVEPEEEYVGIDMVFRKVNGQEQNLFIEWSDDEK